MISILAVIHLALCFLIIVLVLIQDPKGGGVGGMFGGGGGANSLFGASGATPFLAKLTRYVAVVFAASCIAMTIFIKPGSDSVLDNVAIPKAETKTETPAAGATEAPAAEPAAPKANEDTPEQ